VDRHDGRAQELRRSREADAARRLRARGEAALTRGREAASVAALLLLAVALRLGAPGAGWFGVDQARDVRWAELIASGQAYPWLGPLMRNRFHLGALYYYFWSLPAFVSSDPVALYVYAGVLGTLTVALVWWLGRTMLGVFAALAAAALLATSPVAVIDSRIAWAPAALPPWSALLLLAAGRFLDRPSLGRAATLLFVAAFGTQLHVAAAPLALLAGVVVLVRWRALSWRGLALAALAGLVPLLPMIAGLAQPVPAATTPAGPPADPRLHRLADLLALVPRLLRGLTPADAPLLVRGWLLVEHAAVAATLLAALYLLLRPPAGVRVALLRLTVALLVVALAAVLLLPAEAWYYYLDTTLVPGAIVLGGAFSVLPARRAALALLCAVVAVRALLLVWWIGGAAARGYVPANLDFLRLGGAPPAAPDARARLLDVTTKSAAADVLARDLRIPLERMWRDVHGAGFADLDTDNGFFLRRAAATAPPAGGEQSAVVLYRGEFPDAWLARLGAPQRAGPLEIRGYAPLLDVASAVVHDCADPALPVQAPPDPLDYGAGEPAQPAWSCTAPRIELPVRAAAPDEQVRVFARVDGAARVLEVTAEPPAAPIAAPSAGAGVGVALAPGTTRLSVRLAVDGPARLDLYELHGLR
jgi:hypothetical protein